MGKSSSYYILTLPLETQRWQEDILAKRYKVAENIYNAMLRKAYTRYSQMCQTRQYRELRQRLSATSDAKARKEIYQSLDKLAKQYSLGKFELSRDATPYRQYFKENIDSPVSQNLAANVWKAIHTVMIGRGRKVFYKKPGELLALSGKTNNTSIRYKNGSIIWKGLVIPVRFHKNSEYEKAAMKNQIRLCRLKRKKIHDRWHYYVDLVFSGYSPVKQDSKIKKHGKIGLDIGMKQLAVVTSDQVKVFDLPVSYARYQNQMNQLKEYMHRSAYQNNKNNFDENGNVRRGNLKWYYSKKYLRAREKRKELYRKLTAIRKQDYCVLAREIIQMGDLIMTKDLSFSYMFKKRASSAGKKKENHFYSGRIPSFAPGTFAQILQYKMKNAGGDIHRLNMANLWMEEMGQTEKESQEHDNLWQSVYGYRIRQDVYNAFVLSHVDEYEETVNLSEYQNCFPAFVQLCQEYQSNLDETLHILKIS